MRFITIKESHYQGDLIVLKSRLESEGIECRLKNELTTQILNHIPSFLVELQVPEHEMERAREILRETGELAKSTPVVCPECGSDQLDLRLNFHQRVKLLFRTIGGALTMSNPPADDILKNATYSCLKCGNRFNAA